MQTNNYESRKKKTLAFNNFFLSYQNPIKIVIQNSPSILFTNHEPSGIQPSRIQIVQKLLKNLIDPLDPRKLRIITNYALRIKRLYGGQAFPARSAAHIEQSVTGTQVQCQNGQNGCGIHEVVVGDSCRAPSGRTEFCQVVWFVAVYV